MKRSHCTLAALCILLLAGCNLPQTEVPTQSSGLAFTEAAQTLSAELTRIAPTSTQPASPIPQLATLTPLPILPTPTNTSIPNAPPIQVPCNSAAFIADVTYPDGSLLAPGQAFTKTWRLKNVGTCSWTSAYQLVFDSGVQMGGPVTQPLTTGVVSQNQMVDVSVNLIAPSVPGTYQGYWKFRDPIGFTFVLNTGVPIWVDIIVTGPSTSTTTITADTPDPSTPGQSVAVSVTVTGAGTTPTGTVAITGADVNCNITLAGGSGSCNVVFNTTGAKTLTATYNGDAIYATSSDTESHTVNQGISLTTITADAPDPSAIGGTVPVSVNVVGAGVTPTGTVAITGANTNCTITLSAGAGSCNVVFNTAGAKTLTATYSGDANYAASSDTESHTVTQGISLTTITADAPDPSTIGGTVPVSVNVTGAGVTPTGTVAITGANTNCTITLSAGAGSCNVVFNTAGAKTLTATYSGDANYAASSDTESHTVKNASSTAITGDVPDTSTPGQSVMVGVSVNGSGVIPTGTVTITGADVNCTITLAGGSGSCNVVFNTTGAKTLTATYSGDVNYTSSSDTEGHTVVPGPSTTTITADAPDPSTPGQSVAVSVTVGGAGVTPTGTVIITGADINCNITLSAGSGSCNVVFNTTGAKTLTATYSGDMNYSGSSITAAHNVIAGVSVTTITSDLPDPSATGETVTIIVTVSGAGATPTGTVSITSVDSLSVPGPACGITLVGGSGSCTLVFTAVETYTITATYSGDVNYGGSLTTTKHYVN